MHPRHIAIITGVCLVWSMNSIVSKIVVSQIGVPPLCYGMLRSVLIALAVFPWLFPMPQPRLRLMAASFLIGGGSFAIYYVGLRDATVSTAAIVSQIGLLFTTVLSIVMLGERIRWPRALGMAMTLCGTLLVIWDPNGLALSTGLIFVVLSSAAGSLGAILMKQIKGVQALQFQAWAGLSAILPLGLASAVFESGQISTTLAGGLKLAGCVAFSALIVSVVAHTAYYWLIKHYEANMIAPLILMSPVFTVVLGVLLLGDHLGLRIILGAGITLIGVLIIAVRPNRVMPRALLIRERM